MYYSISLIPLVAPVLLLTYALMVVFNIGKAFTHAKRTTEYLGLVGILTSLAGVLIVINQGTAESMLLGYKEIGFSIRLDSLSMTIYSMIALLGFIILKFSSTYLDGDSRKMVFLARLVTTIASVQFLVLSGNLGQLFVSWVITSVCLHYLLVFYRNRPRAIAAARKKFIVARIGDVSLLVASVLIYLNLGTGDLGKIFAEIQVLDSLNSQLTIAAVFLVIAAVFKSAQFPTHGWLIEVVETPTPVSALLHAGLLNAGPFLILRMSHLMSVSTTGSMMLIIIGGLTAMFASVVFLTQPTVKVSLGYSSIAHMGFSLLVCGLGVYSAAILHLVAHSFYKAHSFLSSGSVIDQVRAKKLNIPERKGSLLLIGLSIMFSIVVYLGFCYIWGVKPSEEFGLMAIGSVIVMGLSQILVQTVDTKGSWVAMLQSALMVVAVAGIFFTLEKGAHFLLQDQLPEAYIANTLIKVTVAAIFLGFVAIVFLQLASPKLKHGGFTYRLGIHLRNGFYANIIFDRIVGSLKNDKFKWANLTVREGGDSINKGSTTLSNENKSNNIHNS